MHDARCPSLTRAERTNLQRYDIIHESSMTLTHLVGADENFMLEVAIEYGFNGPVMLQGGAVWSVMIRDGDSRVRTKGVAQASNRTTVDLLLRWEGKDEGVFRGKQGTRRQNTHSNNSRTKNCTIC